MIVAVSGMPFFTAGKLFFIAFSFLSLVLFFLRKGHFTLFSLKVFLAVLFLSFSHALISGEFQPLSFFSGLMYYVFPYIVLHLVGDKFLNIFVKVVYLLAIPALVIHLLIWFVPGVEEFLLHSIAPIFDRDSGYEFYAYKRNILLYTINTDIGMAGIPRNSGPYWEPGAYSGLLLLALMVNVVISGKLKSRKNLLFIISIVSTLSTGGLLAMLIFLLAYYAVEAKSLYAIIGGGMLIIGSWYAYNNVSFINEKFLKQIDSTEDYSDGGDARTTRAVSFFKDFERALDSPLVGFGRSQKAKYNLKDNKAVAHRNNGVGYMLVTWGLPFTFFYFFMYYKGLSTFAFLNGRSKHMGTVILITILTLGFSQVWFSKPLFILLIFLSDSIRYEQRKTIRRYTNFQSQKLS